MCAQMHWYFFLFFIHKLYNVAAKSIAVNEDNKRKSQQIIYKFNDTPVA